MSDEGAVLQAGCCDSNGRSSITPDDLAAAERRATKLLKEHHKQASEIHEDVELIGERITGIERNLSRTSEVLERAADLIQSNAMQQKWMQDEISAFRKDQYRVLWRAVGLLALVISVLLGVRAIN